ncbi:hypothetical protein C8Q78DRAFT_1010938 [Trametes maxima]|nr:hypothetical protein C8Q78DRAFT_1010938 [Trametes maxima]
MLDYAHPSNAEFSLSKIPPDVLWDTRVNPGVLFANGQILKIRVIATVATVQEAGNVINFDMVLFRDIDREGYQRLRRRSKPKPRTYETVMRIQYHGGLPSEVSW